MLGIEDRNRAVSRPKQYLKADCKKDKTSAWWSVHVATGVTVNSDLSACRILKGSVFKRGRYGERSEVYTANECNVIEPYCDSPELSTLSCN